MDQAIPYRETHTALIGRCRQGDQEAYKILYDLYSKAMFGVCMRLLNNRNEAEDHLQESFIAAFHNLAQYRGSGSFGSWLKKIVINRCLDTLKKKKNLWVPIENHEMVYEEGTEAEDIYDSEAIQRAVAQLPDGYRVIMTLYLFEDHSHKAIAEKLGISEGTSKSQYCRARRKLVELIKINKGNHAR